MFPRFQIKCITQIEPQKPKINFNPKSSVIIQGVQLDQKAKDVLLSSFVIGVLGPPGSGKSTLIQQLLLNKQCYNRKFQRVLFIGQTKYNLIQDEYNTSRNVNIDWIYSRIKQANQWGCQNLLIIFDDVISTLSQSKSNSKLKDLFYNRRHLMKSGCISLIVTSQKWSSFPKFVRTCLNGINHRLVGDRLVHTYPKTVLICWYQI